MTEQEQISEAARAMGRIGGARRAARMTPEERSAAASKAGRAPRPGRRKASAQPTE